MRPNQIFAVGGLPFPLVDDAMARAIVATVERDLLTPMGLRSLAPSDPAYCPRYEGGVAQRDGAYHQGTVWPWLIGGFVDAWLRVHGDDAARRAEARRRFVAPLEAHLQTAGLGHVSEIADGDPPHTPRGCPFQAWSTGELIRCSRAQRVTQPARGGGHSTAARCHQFAIQIRIALRRLPPTDVGGHRARLQAPPEHRILPQRERAIDRECQLLAVRRRELEAGRDPAPRSRRRCASTTVSASPPTCVTTGNAP